MAIRPPRRPPVARGGSARHAGLGRHLRARLAAFARARRRVNALRFAAVGLVAGGVLAAIVGSADQIFGQVLGLNVGATVVPALFFSPILIGLVLGWLRPVREAQVAFEVDHALALDERVTTALELSHADRAGSGAESTPLGSSLPRALLADEQIADALARLGDARPEAVYPARVPRSWLLAMLAGLLLALGPWLIPWPALFGGATPASAVSAANQAQAARLDALAQQLASDQSLDPQTRDQLAAQLRQAAAQLRSDGPNGRQASQDLLHAEQATAATAPATGEDASLTLARIADALNTQAATQGVTRALDNQDIPGATAAMNQVASDVARMTPEQRQAVASALQAASDAAQGSDTSAAAQLQQAADAAKQGDPNGTRRASQAIQQLGAASQAQQDAAQAQSALEDSRQAIDQATQSDSASAANQTGPGPSADASASQDGAAAQDGSSPPDGAPLSDTAATPSGSPSSAQSANSPDGANGASSAGAAPGSPSGQSPADPGNPAGSGDQSGQNGANGSGNPSGNGGNQDGQQSGGGYGTGSTQHLGNPNQIQGAAQREVVVPQDPNAPLTSVSPSSQTEAGTPGTARVDYQTVLPQYRQQALQGMDSSAVPNDLRNVVKGYFDSLSAK